MVVDTTPCTNSRKGGRGHRPAPFAAHSRPQDSRRVKAQYDGGADEHIIPLKVLRDEFPSATVRPAGDDHRILHGLPGLVSAFGQVEFAVAYNGRQFLDNCVVADADINVLIGNGARLDRGPDLRSQHDPD